jgi:AhpC/TSA family
MPCQEHLVEVRERRGELEALGAGVIAVGFSPAEPLAALARYLEWPWPMLSDPERRLYARLQLPRVGLRDVYTPGTLRRYAASLLHGRRIRRPVEDTRQMGGDAIVAAGAAVQVFRPRSPDDRVPVETLVAVLRAAMPGVATR